MNPYGEPTEPWLSPGDSRPDPAAYLRAQYVPQEEPGSTPPLYPSGPTVPPPPISAPPVYFSMLYPKDRRKRGAGLVIGIVVGLVLATLAGVAAARMGFSSSSSARAPLPRASATALPVGVNPTPISRSTPGTHPTGIVTPAPTHLGATPTGVPETATPLPPLDVTIGCITAPKEDPHHAQFCVQTAANATLAMSFVYCDGPQEPNVPQTATTDSTGYHFVTWNSTDRFQGPNCKIHTGQLTVQATKGKQSGTATATITFG